MTGPLRLSADTAEALGMEPLEVLCDPVKLLLILEIGQQDHFTVLSDDGRLWVWPYIAGRAALRAAADLIISRMLGRET